MLLSSYWHSIGTAGLAVQVVGSNWPKPHYTLLITGLCRFRVSQLLRERPFPVAEVEQLDKLEQYTEGDPADGELGELSQRFYQAAVQVSAKATCVSLFILWDSLYKTGFTGSWSHICYWFGAVVYSVII